MASQRARIECLESIVRDLRKAEAISEAREQIIRWVDSLSSNMIGGMNDGPTEQIEHVRKRARQLSEAYATALRKARQIK